MSRFADALTHVQPAAKQLADSMNAAIEQLGAYRQTAVQQGGPVAANSVSVHADSARLAREFIGVLVANGLAPVFDLAGIDLRRVPQSDAEHADSFATRWTDREAHGRFDWRGPDPRTVSDARYPGRRFE